MAELAKLEASVKSEFDAYHQHGSVGDRPDPRIGERDRLQTAERAASWEATLSERANAGIEVAAAAHVVETLRGQLVARRHAVLVEAAEPIAEGLRALAAEMANRFGSLCALGVLTNGEVLKSGKIIMPSLRGGPFTLEVSPTRRPRLAGWPR